MRVVVGFLLLWLRTAGCSWIFSGIPLRELDEARDIGRKAKVEFLNKIVGQADHLKSFTENPQYSYSHVVFFHLFPPILVCF
ncbi:hypothetical protein RB195_006579 [Necator americanus]|uniref:Uncharacterized protein n=1 Tax=Necator americanus TaxID=51031 RepID=A0ABR1BTA6_NECAM